MEDLTFLKIKHLIVHELPKKRSGAETAGILSDTVSPLVPRVRDFFEGRIRIALSPGIPIGFDPALTSPVPSCVRDLLCTPQTAFIPASHTIASHLFSIQTAVHSEGLLCIAECELNNASAIAIIKLELEEGVRAELVGPKGSQHFVIHVIDDLMLTKNTKVFKVALFEVEAGGDVSSIGGRACDNQRTRAQLLAGYFLTKFLGCRLLDEPDVMTKKFLDVAEGFVNSRIADPVLKAQYMTAIVAEMNRNVSTITPRTFVNENLEPRHRTTFLEALTAGGVSTTRFHKDPELVKARLTRARFDFGTGETALIPPGALGTSTNLRPGTDGRTRLEIDSKLTSTKGAR